MSETKSEILVPTAFGEKTMIQVMDQLRAPFYWDDLEWRVGNTNKEKTQGSALVYITNRAVQDRLDEVMGTGFWRNEKYEPFRNVGVLGGLSLLINGEWITKWDGADQTEVSSTKGGFSDAMKRCAYHWGIGRYLYKLPRFWEQLDDRKQIKILPLAKFPEWALPVDDPALAEKKKRSGASGGGYSGNTGGASQGGGQGASSSAASQYSGAGITNKPSGLSLPGKPGGAQSDQGSATADTSASTAGSQPERPNVPANATPNQPTGNGLLSLTVKIKAAPTEETAASGQRKGQVYILIQAEDKEGQTCQLVGFETVSKDALRSQSVGGDFTGDFREVGVNSRGKIYEMVAPVQKAS